ncbi:MAG: flagellar basal body L-ring protein FlgH [Alphaproteobacteria bacterium]
MKKISTHLIFCSLLLLPACNSLDRLQNIGKEPDLSDINREKLGTGIKQVSLPMPNYQPEIRQQNSLWQSGARSFFKDQRATRVGDVLTVTIEINDNATINNQTERGRTNAESTGVPNVLGFETKLANILPNAVDASKLLDTSSDSKSKGTGKITRNESIKLQVAALISQVLPNGNLLIQGRQEVRVNFEVRELLVTGVVRPEDISPDNTISYEKIAEARISYGGRGQISDVQQPRYGQQLMDIILPF